MNAQVFKTPAGEEMVVLSRAEYDALIARLEELEEDADDAEAARAAKAEDTTDTMLRTITPLAVCSSFLRARRKSAGMTQTELADATELAQGFISDLESGRRKPSPDVLGRIADVLGIGGLDLDTLRDGYRIEA